MQDDLFGAPPPPPEKPTLPRKAGALAPAEAPAPGRPPTRRTGKVELAASAAALGDVAGRMPPTLRLGTSSWTYPGWQGLVWEGAHSEAQLSRHGLATYAGHPLLRTVSLDRNFYRPLTVAQYERYASQVPEDFRFVVKCPSLITDALVRTEDGRGREPNPAFLNAALAVQEFVEPALQGLGAKLGALVFQFSPLPLQLLDRWPQVLSQLDALLAALPPLHPRAPDAVVATEWRDPECVGPALAQVLRAHGATYCLGLHPKMPPLAQQLPLLRALWPGPLVCRWSLHERHGPYGYADAERLYAPYDRLHDPDPATLHALARVITGVCGAGQNAFVTISNHAEGCAPLTVQRLAQALAGTGEGES